MRNIREDQAKQKLNYEGELALYPKHLVLVESWNPEIEKKLNARGIPNVLVKGSYFGIVQVLFMCFHRQRNAVNKEKHA